MKKLGALLAVVGVVGSGVVLYVARPGVTSKELRGATRNCPDTHVTCITLEGNSYHRRALAARDCRDAGFGYVLTSRLPALVDGTCEAAGEGVVPPIELPLECACRRDAGVCDVALPDGGTAPAPYGLTLQPGWSGPGCERKSCVELWGAPSWPVACPGR